jgi:hypothetical protein
LRNVWYNKGTEGERIPPKEKEKRIKKWKKS